MTAREDRQTDSQTMCDPETRLYTDFGAKQGINRMPRRHFLAGRKKHLRTMKLLTCANGNDAIVFCPSWLHREGPRRKPFARAIDCSAFCIRVRMRTH
jgi:hypothetical protein